MIDGLAVYPDYKDSGVDWIGQVPTHWGVMPGRACYYERKESNTGLKEKTVLSLSYGKIVVKPDEKLHGLVPESFETYQIVDPGDIIIRPTDLQNDWNSLRFGISHNRGIITSAYLCFRTKEIIERNYGHLLLHTYDLNKIFYGLGSGLRQNLDWNDFKYLPCLVPPLPEQAAIVRYHRWSEQQILRLISAKRRVIEYLNEQKQAIISRAVTRGLDPNVLLKPSGIEWLGNIPESWEIVRLKKVASIVLGKMLKKSPSNSFDRRKPYLRSKNIQWFKPKMDDVFEMWFSPREIKDLRLKKEDVLVSEGGEVGRACLWNDELPECYIQNSVHKVTPKKDFRSQFLFYQFFLMGKSGYFESIVNRVSIAHLTREKLIDVRFVQPSIKEQDLIIEIIEKECAAIDNLIQQTVQEIDLIQESRTRLISDIVTGKLDVRDNKIEEISISESENDNLLDPEVPNDD